MPLPPPTLSPKELTTSALPSPVVSRSTRTPPRPPPTATRMSPFSRTTRWRAGPLGFPPQGGPKQPRPAARAAARGEDVAVLQDDEVARRADGFRDNERAETGRHGQPGVIGGADRFGGFCRRVSAARG